MDIFAVVRKLLVISILSILIVQSVSYAQLSKIPALFSHFVTHKVIHNIDIADFISMHYLGNDIDDDDHEDDMKLPFKKFDVHFASVFYIPDTNILTFLPTVIEYAKVDYPFYKLINWKNPLLDNIHRPPCC